VQTLNVTVQRKTDYTIAREIARGAALASNVRQRFTACATSALCDVERF
jgi:hypothetical protein